MRRRAALLFTAILAAAALTVPAPGASAQPGPPADRLPYGIPVPPG